MLERLPSSYAHLQHSSKQTGIWDGTIASVGLLLNLFLFELCLSLGCLETKKKKTNHTCEETFSY